MTEDINSNPDNRNVNIQNINIPVFSSDDYIRNSFAKANPINFSETYNKIVDDYLLKRYGKKNKPNISGEDITYLFNTAIKFVKVVIRLYRYLLKIFYKSRKIINLFNFKRIFLKKD